MLSLVVLGIQNSGKGSLVRHLYSQCTQALSDSTATEYSVEGRGSYTNILKVNSTAPPTHNYGSLGTRLARLTVPAVLVTMPRDVRDVNATKEWVRRARDYCPDAKIALVVTKCDLKHEDQHQEHSSKKSASLLGERLFDKALFDIMQAASGVNRLFHTSVVTSQGMSGVKCWLEDTMQGFRTGTDYSGFGQFNEARPPKSRFRKKSRDTCSTSVGCDSCHLQ